MEGAGMLVGVGGDKGVEEREGEGRGEGEGEGRRAGEAML
jgi:hypothetical protein